MRKLADLTCSALQLHINVATVVKMYKFLNLEDIKNLEASHEAFGSEIKMVADMVSEQVLFTVLVNKKLKEQAPEIIRQQLAEISSRNSTAVLPILISKAEGLLSQAAGTA